MSQPCSVLFPLIRLPLSCHSLVNNDSRKFCTETPPNRGTIRVMLRGIISGKAEEVLPSNSETSNSYSLAAWEGRKPGRGPFPRCSPCPFLSLVVITKLSTIIKWNRFPSCLALGKSPISLVLLPTHTHMHMRGCTHMWTHSSGRPFTLPNGIVMEGSPLFSLCCKTPQP